MRAQSHTEGLCRIPGTETGVSLRRDWDCERFWGIGGVAPGLQSLVACGTRSRRQPDVPVGAKQLSHTQGHGSQRGLELRDKRVKQSPFPHRNFGIGTRRENPDQGTPGETRG